MSILSVHSRRTLPTQRSATAFALGARGGFLITSMPSAVNTVEGGGELGITIAQQEPQGRHTLVQLHQ